MAELLQTAGMQLVMMQRDTQLIKYSELVCRINITSSVGACLAGGRDAFASNLNLLPQTVRCDDCCGNETKSSTEMCGGAYCEMILREHGIAWCGGDNL